MKTTAWLLLLVVPLSSWMPLTEVQSLSYDIFVGDSKIGDLRAIKKSTPPMTVYSVQTNISFKLFETYDVNYQLSSSYKNNYLVESALKNIVNGKLEDNVHIKWNGSQYIGQANNKAVALKEKIKHSIAYLYFSEPVGIDRIFSEKYADFEKLKTNNNKEYVLHLGDGNKSHYRYKNGVCAEVSSNKSLFKILIKLKQ